MKTYPSYWLWYRNEPFISVSANNQKDVEQFIVDYCMSNNIRPVADEWIIRQVDLIVTKDVIGEIINDMGQGAPALNGPIGSAQTMGKGYEPVRVKMHPRCF